MKAIHAITLLFFISGLSINAQDLNSTFKINKIELSNPKLQAQLRNQKRQTSLQVNKNTVRIDQDLKQKSKKVYSNKGIYVGLYFCTFNGKGFESGASITYYFSKVFGIRLGLNYTQASLRIGKNGGYPSFEPKLNKTFDWNSVSVPIDLVYTGKRRFSLYGEVGIRVFFPLQTTITFEDPTVIENNEPLMRSLEFVDVGLAFEMLIGGSYRVSEKINIYAGLQISGTQNATSKIPPHNIISTFSGLKIGINYNLKKLQ